MDPIRNLLVDWISREPAAGIWLAVAAALLFGIGFSRRLRGNGRAPSWVQALAGAAAGTLVFAGTAGMVYFLLSSGFEAFSRVFGPFVTNGSLSNQAWEKWRHLYGSNFVQSDLQVAQTVHLESLEMIPPADPAGKPLYHTVGMDEPVAGSSIASFDGRVTMNIADPVQQTDTFNGYVLSALYTYEIVNPADSDTRVVYRFPLTAETKLFQDLTVQLNGQDAPGWRIADRDITWEANMHPGQKDVVSIHYVSWGMDSFVFYLPDPREVTDFKLTVALDTDNC